MAEFKDALRQQISNDLLFQLVNLSFLESANMTDAVKFASETGDDPYILLKNDGLFLEQILVKSLSDKYGLGFALEYDLPIIDAKFPLNYCVENGLIPISIQEQTFALGLSSPSSLNAIRNLNLLYGKKLNAFFIPYTKLIDDIKYVDNPDSRNSKPVINLKTGDSHKEPQTEAKASIASVSGEREANISEAKPIKDAKPRISNQQFKVDSQRISKQVQSMLVGDVVSGLNEILTDAVNEKVSDVHFEVFRDKARLRFRKNGTLITPVRFQDFVSKNYNAIISRLKIMSDLDIAEKRLPQDGAANFISKKDNIDVDLRVSIIPLSTGERAVLRILNKASLSVDVYSLGFSERQLATFLRSIDSPQGLVLVTGPTGSGKSTTLYGAINHLNQEDVNILTAEDPIEYNLSGVGQVQMKEDIGLTFAAALRSFLRQDPEIILVGEIRDGETADIATKAALTGHLVLSTLHTNSSIGAITRLINMGLPKYLVSNALTCIVAQRLIRTNCPMCKTSRTFTDAEPALSQPIFKHLIGRDEFFGSGCNECNMTGFSARRAVHEVLEIDAELKSMINHDASEIEMLVYKRENGFSTMLERGLDFVHAGDTTLEELLRTVPMEIS
jgi:type IV pilus assembly protein PilB